MRSKRVWVFALFLAICVGALPSAFGQEDGFRNQQEEVLKLVSSLEANVGLAARSLEDIANMKPDDQEKVVDESFNKITNEVSRVMDQLNSNGPLMDALERAKASVIVLRDWYKRQDVTYLRRDENVAALDGALNRYDEIALSIEEGRNASANHLRDLKSKHRAVLQELKVRRVENSVRIAQEVVNSLSGLTRKLHEISGAELPGLAVPN